LCCVARPCRGQWPVAMIARNSSQRAPLFAAVFLGLAVRLAAEVTLGMPEAELLAEKGNPSSRAVAGSRAIYDWPDMRVTVVDGVVAKIAPRDPEASPPAAMVPVVKTAPVPDALAAAREAFVRSESGKQIWATSLLGQRAPRIVVEKWLTPAPVKDGRFQLVDFWATWCPPCREAIKELNEIHRRFADRVDVVGISDEPEEAVRRMREPVIDYFVGIDTHARTKNALAVTGIPHVLIIDPSGIVRWEGYPLLQGHRLSADVVQKVLDLYSN
jgi:cytochrome c biogenesis protein CcmG, thiol:disulfide interchange protein DsbE